MICAYQMLKFQNFKIYDELENKTVSLSLMDSWGVDKSTAFGHLALLDKPILGLFLSTIKCPYGSYISHIVVQQTIHFFLHKCNMSKILY